MGWCGVFLSTHSCSDAFRITKAMGVRFCFDPIQGKRKRSITAHVFEVLLKRLEMNAILDTTPNGVCIVSCNGVTRCNPAALRMFGVASLEELRRIYGRSGEGFLLRWPNTQLPLREHERPLARALLGEKVTEVLQAIHGESGRALTLRITAAPILIRGRIIGAVAIHSDITPGPLDGVGPWSNRQTGADPATPLRSNDLLARETHLREQAERDLQSAHAEIQELKKHLHAENQHLFQEINHACNFGEVIGQSHCLETLFSQVEDVAPQDSTVLLLGETGTGKGLVARAIHSRSLRSHRPFVIVNCSALPGNLIESELFGREKGAFTGASSQQLGRFELADKATILLDEIGDLPFELQAKLLHVIQEGEFSRLGSARTIKVDVRIIAATNRDLYEAIRLGRFREDLFYRLNIFPITVPPLRDRKGDIPLLVQHFLAKLNRKLGKDIQSVTDETMEQLVAHTWPGNVRELESVIERAAITSRGTTLQVLDHFDTALPTMSHPQDGQLLVDLERDYIGQVLKKTHWRIEGANGAANLLGLNPSTLRGRMRKEGLHRP